MRVLVTSTGYPGHQRPTLQVGQACRDAGHEVLVAAPRSRTWIARQRGFEVAGLADPPPDALRALLRSVAVLPAREGHEQMIAEGFGRVATRSSLADVLTLVRRWRPDVLLRESQEFAGVLAAESQYVPHARVALGLASSEDQTISLAAPVLDEQREQLWLARDPVGDRLRTEPAFSLVPGILEHPAAEGRHVRRYRPASAPPAIHEPVVQRLAGFSPLVYLSFGSAAASLGFFPRLYRTAIDALAARDLRLLVTVGFDVDPRALGKVPPNVQVERWLSQASVLPHVDAVVCHGGYGSVLGALAHGVPVVSVPIFAGDQWENSRRLEQIGAGIAVEGDPGDGRGMLDGPPDDVIASLPDAVERVTSERHYGEAALRIADAIDRLPSVGRAADALREMAHPSATTGGTHADTSRHRSVRTAR